jgi:hypothetical protein
LLRRVGMVMEDDIVGSLTRKKSQDKKKVFAQELLKVGRCWHKVVSRETGRETRAPQ